MKQDLKLSDPFKANFKARFFLSRPTHGDNKKKESLPLIGLKQESFSPQV